MKINMENITQNEFLQYAKDYPNVPKEVVEYITCCDCGELLGLGCDAFGTTWGTCEECLFEEL